MKYLRRYIRNTLVRKLSESMDSEEVANLNMMLDNADQAYDDGEAWEQVYELIDTIYGDEPPPELKIWGAADMEDGTILAHRLTMKQAMSYHLKNPNYVPCDENGVETNSPQRYRGGFDFCYREIEK